MKRYEGPNSFDEYVLAREHDAEIAELIEFITLAVYLYDDDTDRAIELINKYKKEG